MLEAKYIGHKELDRKIKKVRKNLSNFKVVNKSIVIFLDQEIQKQFKTEGVHLTKNKWESLKEATINRRRNKAPPYRILQDTGFLKSRWEHIFTQRKAAIKSKVEYGIYHDEGRGHLPERKIIPDTENVIFKNNILKIYSLWIKKQRKIFK